MESMSLLKIGSFDVSNPHEAKVVLCFRFRFCYGV